MADDYTNEDYMDDELNDSNESIQSETAEREDRQAQRQEMFRQRLNTQKQDTAINRQVQRIQSSQKMRNSAAFNQTLEATRSKAKLALSDKAMLLMVAGFFDLIGGLINLIPVVGGAAAIVVATAPGKITLRIMHHKYGINTKDSKIAKIFWGSATIEAIPLVNALPALILGEVLTILAHESSA